MLIKEAELKEKIELDLRLKFEADLKEKIEVLKETIEAKLSQKIKTELRSELLDEIVVHGKGNETCPSSCLSIIKPIGNEVVANAMSINNVALNVEDLRVDLDENVKDLKDDLEESVHQLSLNDSTIQETLHHEIQVEIQKVQDEIDITDSHVEAIREMPIGSIISWVLKPSLDSAHEEALPGGWVRCDGRLIPEPSVWAGSHTPNLNGERLFLRGGADSESLALEEDAFQDHLHNDIGHTHLTSGHSHSYVDRYASYDENSCDDDTSGNAMLMYHATTKHKDC